LQGVDETVALAKFDAADRTEVRVRETGHQIGSTINEFHSRCRAEKESSA
jgi:hypothetical protein